MNVSESEFKVFMKWQPLTQYLRFERPSTHLAQSYAAMRDAFMAVGEDEWTGKQAIAHQSVDEYITMVLNWSRGEDLPKNWGPCDEYWILKDDVVVGDCGIRYPLTPQLEQWGGHIGYAVHPAYRNQGIATFAMREGLRLLADKGVGEALVTCAHDNVASIRVIEKFGARRIDDSMRRRYLVPTGIGIGKHPIIQSARLRLSEFEMTDAADVYNCITPAITKYMFWEPPSSFAAYKARREETLQSTNRNGFSFVIRRTDTRECLGIASLDGLDAAAPELGLWLKETAHGKGYGTEVVRAVADWAARTLGKERFTYAVARENIPSRRIAEALGGEVVGTRTSPKYDSVVYRIPWPPGRALA